MLTLHEAFVPACRQIVGGMLAIVDKAEAHCTAAGIDHAEMIEARLAETMWTLPWHVRAVWVHSAFAIARLASGEFSPDFTDLPKDWDAMRAQLRRTDDELAAVDPDTLEALAGSPVGFVLGGRRLMDFTAQNFLLSFSQPNFYFHAATFYDILRMKGLDLGKRDYMGVPRFTPG